MKATITSIFFVLASVLSSVNADVLSFTLDMENTTPWENTLFSLTNTSDSASITSFTLGHIGSNIDVWEERLSPATTSFRGPESNVGVDNNDGEFTDFIIASFSKFDIGDSYDFLADHDGYHLPTTDTIWLDNSTIEVEFSTGETLSLLLTGAPDPSHTYSFSASMTSAVPEPSTSSVLALGLFSLGLFRRRK